MSSQKIPCQVCGKIGTLQHLSPNYFRINHYTGRRRNGNPICLNHRQDVSYVTKLLGEEILKWETKPMSQAEQLQLFERGLRRCKTCAQIKPLAEFYTDGAKWRKNKKRRIKRKYFKSYCKECVKQKVRDYYKKNRAKRISYQRNFYKKNSRYYINYEYTRPIEYRLFRLMAQSFLLENECMLCGSEETISRHHPRYFDYNLDYAWIFCTLCSKCHHEEDRFRDEWIVEEVG